VPGLSQILLRFPGEVFFDNGPTDATDARFPARPLWISPTVHVKAAVDSTLEVRTIKRRIAASENRQAISHFAVQRECVGKQWVLGKLDRVNFVHGALWQTPAATQLSAIAGPDQAAPAKEAIHGNRKVDTLAVAAAKLARKTNLTCFQRPLIFVLHTGLKRHRREGCV
jgi:hypothetical protein